METISKLMKALDSFDPLLSLLIGGLIGFVFKAIIEKFKIKYLRFNALFSEYLQSRKELTELLSEIATLGVAPKYSEQEISRWKTKISVIYYKNYDFLPHEVLVELNCLYLCLSANGVCFVTATKDSDLKKLYFRRNLKKYKKEVKDFIREVMLIRSAAKQYEKLIDHPNLISRSTVINFQARKVLSTFNLHFKYKSIIDWGKELKKFSTRERSSYFS